MNNALYIATLLVGFLFTSCGGNAHRENDHEHDHDHLHETQLLLSAYNDRLEVFIEAHPFSIGNPSSVIVHITNLETFKPVDSAHITLKLVVDTNETSQTTDKPVKKGIYQFELQPESKGSGMLDIDIETSRGIQTLKIGPVNVFTDEHTADEDASQYDVDELPNTIVFTKEQSWNTGFATSLSLIEPFGQVIKTTAQVQSAQDDEEMVSARTAGIVLFTDQQFTEGRPVSASQHLFTVSGAGLADNNASVRFSEAQNNYQRTKSVYERAKDLSKDKLVSERELLEAQSNFETAQAIYDNLRRNFNTTGQQVASPINGFVKKLSVVNGQYVEAGQPLVVVSRNKNLFLKAEVQQRYAPVLPYITSANIINTAMGSTYTLEQLNGKVLSYGRSTNNDNNLLPLSFRIDNQGDFISGSFVKLFIKTRTNTQALTVPNTALMEEQGLFFVFVQITPELFEKREIAIGGTDGIRTEVLSGMTTGERIVSKGAIAIKLAQASGALDPHAGHVH